MLSPPRPAAAAVTGAPARRGRLRLFVLVAAVIALAMAVVFPFAPVRQADVTYAWRASEGAAAIALMPYQPVRLAAHAACVRDPGRHLLLSTVPPQPDPAAAPLHGLVLTTADGVLDVQSAGVELFSGPLPAGDCALAVTSDPAGTTVTAGGTTLVERAGDVRPDVAGAFSDLPDGADLAVQADTRFETEITPLKTAIAIVGVLATIALLGALAIADRRARGRSATLPDRPVGVRRARWWRPRLVDAAVAAMLLVWWLVGSLTVDDGYITGIVRTTGENGFIGNVYRWLNAPEAPFSWFYDVYYAWSLVSPSPLWMRLPATALGFACWLLLTRRVLPRLGVFARRRATPWLAALAFATWWVPLQLGLRPEPWVAVCGLLVFVAVEHAVATRRVLPLALGLVVAGVSTALTPAGLMAFTPFLAGGLPVLRLLRQRRDLHVWPLVAALVAAPASAVYLMVTDQSLAGMLEATRVRSLIGGGAPWYEEYQRYSALLEPSSFQGSIGRRAAVLVTLLAAVGVLWALRSTLPRVGAGIATGPTRRLAVGLLLSFATFTASPTKWTQHFGDVAGLGTAVLTVALVVFTSRATSPRAVVTGLAAVTGVGSLVLAGYNAWPYVSGWWAPTFSTLPPRVAGQDVTTVVLVLGGLLVAGLLLRFAWRTSGGAAVHLPRWVPGPSSLVVVLLAVVLLLQVGANVRTTVAHRTSFTMGTDSVATLTGRSCGLERLLSVETDPTAGLLAGSAERTRFVDVGGALLPGLDVDGSTTTGWFALDPAQRSDELPVVLTTLGHMRPGDDLTAEFGDGTRIPVRTPTDTGVDAPRDVRLMAPRGADAVRLVIDARTGSAPAQVTLPRVPRLTPMLDVLPAGSAAIVDWPVAFVFPCVTPAPLVLGSAGLPRWRISPPQDDVAAGITYAPSYGGPFAAARLLVTEQRMATYLQGDPTRDAASLVRWVPVVPLHQITPVVADQTVSGTHRDGHARVPGLDPVG